MCRQAREVGGEPEAAAHGCVACGAAGARGGPGCAVVSGLRRARAAGRVGPLVLRPAFPPSRWVPPACPRGPRRNSPEPGSLPWRGEPSEPRRALRKHRPRPAEVTCTPSSSREQRRWGGKDAEEGTQEIKEAGARRSGPPLALDYLCGWAQKHENRGSQKTRQSWLVLHTCDRPTEAEKLWSQARPAMQTQRKTPWAALRLLLRSSGPQALPPTLSPAPRSGSRGTWCSGSCGTGSPSALPAVLSAMASSASHTSAGRCRALTNTTGSSWRSRSSASVFGIPTSLYRLGSWLVVRITEAMHTT
ncbi:Uncharacterized protein Cadr_000000355 [Camelus dromedarius]|uniref:Uncharacterized protein n=1 Tax=Camelus dromedarius TaxID=9838 RepID=A0A5N4EIE0_CAMDR|nr:Uncharacterized protein Cadr_000000355 [Camelus dromedarius]